MKDYIFVLGREPDLSFAELVSIWGTDVIRSWNFAFFSCDESQVLKETKCLGWTIKVGEIVGKNINKNSLTTFCADIINHYVLEGKKLRVGIDSFIPSLSKTVFKVKDALKEKGASIRVVQHDNGRTKTATTIHEKLITQWVELIITPEQEGLCVARTIWIQDIEAYSERDINRDRSMVVGMMPPKLAQMMLCYATHGKRDLTVWDPFCGLGTTLIEALHGGYFSLIWSDISGEMVTTSQKNIAQSIKGAPVALEIFHHDAQKIDTKILSQKTVIVTEGMLGKNFSSSTISHATVLQERKQLTELYGNFFRSSHENKYIDAVVCCLPFWNVGKETIYMPLFENFSTQWKTSTLCHSGKRYIKHMRPGQYVWREILILERD